MRVACSKEGKVNSDSERLVITTDEMGANAIEDVARSEEGLQFTSRRVQAQVGDPSTWVMVGQISGLGWPALSAALLLLIRQRKIKRIKIGNDEFENITPEQFERIMSSRSERNA